MLTQCPLDPFTPLQEHKIPPIHGTSSHVREFFLWRKEPFQPSLFRLPLSAEIQKLNGESKGRFTFEVLEIPLERILQLWNAIRA
jgi:hypothetical protein